MSTANHTTTESPAHVAFLDSLKSINDFTNDLINSGVYCIYCEAENRYYIGQSQIVIKRVADHLTMLRSSRHPTDSLQRDFNKHGEKSFKFGVILDMPDSTEAQRCNEETKEILLYQKYNRHLYNVNLNSRMRTQKRSFPDYSTPSTKRKKHSNKHKGHKGHISNEPYRAEMKKLDMSKTEKGTCKDCGASGVLYLHIFICDDSVKRCAGCIDKHLQGWRFKVGQPQQQKNYKSGACFRWLIDDRKHIKEVLTMAVSRYIEKHGKEPDSILVNETYEGPAEFESIGVFARSVTPRGYIDIPI